MEVPMQEETIIYTMILDLPEQVEDKFYKSCDNKFGYKLQYINHCSPKLATLKQKQLFLRIQMIKANQKKWTTPAQQIAANVPVEGLDQQSTSSGPSE